MLRNYQYGTSNFCLGDQEGQGFILLKCNSNLLGEGKRPYLYYNNAKRHSSRQL